MILDFPRADDLPIARPHGQWSDVGGVKDFGFWILNFGFWIFPEQMICQLRDRTGNGATWEVLKGV